MGETYSIDQSKGLVVSIHGTVDGSLNTAYSFEYWTDAKTSLIYSVALPILLILIVIAVSFYAYKRLKKSEVYPIKPKDPE